MVVEEAVVEEVSREEVEEVSDVEEEEASEGEEVEVEGVVSEVCFEGLSSIGR